MPGIDSTSNEWRFRIRNPKLFDKFRTHWFKMNGKRMGIYIVYGRMIDSRKWEIQSVRFKKDKYSLSESRKWMTGHRIKKKIRSNPFIGAMPKELDFKSFQEHPLTQFPSDISLAEFEMLKKRRDILRMVRPSAGVRWIRMDETRGEYRFRYQEPEQFTYKSMQYPDDDKSKGYYFVMGRTKNRFEIQGIRFKKDKFTEAEARKFLENWEQDNEFSIPTGR